MFDDEVREQIFAKSELQKIDLMTLSLVIKAIEERLKQYTIRSEEGFINDKGSFITVFRLTRGNQRG